MKLFRSFVGALFLLSSHPLAAATADDSLMITNPKITKSALARDTGAWSFGGLSQELAKAYYNRSVITPAEYNSFIRTWLAQFSDTRPGIKSQVICRWANAASGSSACDTTILEAKNAPFKLLAISYRPDLADASCSDAEGEFRFTFGLTSESIKGRHPSDISGTEMTFIFEYDLKKAEHISRDASQWAQTFKHLDRVELCKDFCPAYVNELQGLSASITNYNPSLPLRSAIGQVRSNEIVGDARFNPILTGALRQLGDLVAACYVGLKNNPSNPAQGFSSCASTLVPNNFSDTRIRSAVTGLKSTFSAMSVAASSPLSLPIPSNLVQPLTNALVTLTSIGPIWEMREFKLSSIGLKQSPLHDTPDFSHNNSPLLLDFVQQNAEAILDGSIKISDLIEFDPNFEKELAAPASPFDFWRFYASGGSDSDLVKDARLHSKFAIMTCQGCHATQTAPNGVIQLVNDLILHSKTTSALGKNAKTLLAAHSREELHIDNVDGFYMISPIKNPGADGKGHLAGFLTKKNGHLSRLTNVLNQLAQGCSVP